MMPKPPIRPADLIAAGWKPWKKPNVEGIVWEHKDHPGEYSFMAAALMVEHASNESDDTDV